MKGMWLGVAAILLAATAARADTVVLKDGRQIQGDVTYVGEEVVVTRACGSARFAKDLVANIRSTKEDDEAAAKARAEKAQEQKISDAKLAELVKAVSGDKRFQPLPATEALHWEKDPKEARRLAADQKKIVLLFSVVGELGTGHC